MLKRSESDSLEPWRQCTGHLCPPLVSAASAVGADRLLSCGRTLRRESEGVRVRERGSLFGNIRLSVRGGEEEYI